MQASPFAPYIKESGDETNEYAALIKSAFNKALREDTELPGWILSLHGMSGKRYRIFINNLVKSLNDARYLEVGSWSGSTACSAIFGNKAYCACIDNWSEFGGPRDEFQKNVKNAISADGINDLHCYEQDFRTVDYEGIGKFNIYLFDGPHSTQDQYDGLVYALPALENVFIFIVDDWNDPRPRDGTRQALEELGIEVVYSMQIRTSNGIDRVYPEVVLQHSHWHNGYFISVCKKPATLEA